VEHTDPVGYPLEAVENSTLEHCGALDLIESNIFESMMAIEPYAENVKEKVIKEIDVKKLYSTRLICI
jgi:hypothetical protein